MARISAQALAPPAFEVASVKPHTSDDQAVVMAAQPGGRFTARNVPLRLLIRTAYRIQDDQLSGGPSWVNTDRFDISAKADEAVPPVQIAAMLQTLIVERFSLMVHHETKELPIYALVLARGDGAFGAAFRPTECPSIETDFNQPNRPCATISTGVGRLNLRGAPLSQFLQFLAPAVNRVLVDRTGLTGRFDLDLEWTPAPSAAPVGQDAAPVDPNGTSIFTAVQEQLGLKLESTKAAVDVIVIDRVEHPTED